MHGPWFIPPSDFIARMEPDDRQALFALTRHTTLEKDEFVFQAGDPGHNVYLIADGRIKIFQIAPTGKELILWFCFPGEVFGLAELARSGQREVFAQTCSPAEILSVPRDAFQRFLMAHPRTAMQVIDLLSCRLRVLTDMMLNLATDDVGARLIKLILRLGARYGRQIGNEIQLDIALTHQEMADMIGCSRQTVTTTLGALRRRGLLHIEQHHIRIHSDELQEYIAVASGN